MSNWITCKTQHRNSGVPEERLLTEVPCAQRTGNRWRLACSLIMAAGRVSLRICLSEFGSLRAIHDVIKSTERLGHLDLHGRRYGPRFTVTTSSFCIGPVMDTLQIEDRGRGGGGGGRRGLL